MMVSVIVPVYNAEKYLRRCLDSILSQTFQNIELVLVDDGSTDGSTTIINEYAQSDSRVVVVCHSQNKGLFAARKSGMDAASGEYTIYVDADDWIEKNQVEELYRHAIQEDADMVICDFYKHFEDRIEYVSQSVSNLSSDYILKQIIHMQIYPSLWNKMIRRKCFYDPLVHFAPEHIHYGEDTLLVCRILHHGCRVAYLPKAFYHYNAENEGSVTHTINEKKLLSRGDFIKVLEEEFHLEGTNDLNLYKKYYLMTALENGHYPMLDTFPEIHDSLIREGKPFRLFLPVSSCLSLALRGYPRTAHTIYRTITGIIRLKKKHLR